MGMLVLGLAASVPDAMAQEVPKREYLRFVPLNVPRLIRQTAASERIHLYGNRFDPAYRDVEQVDGIDDRRFAVLERMAVRFAPFLVMNSSAVPLDFRAFEDGAAAFPLYVDTWNTSVPGSALVAEETIDMLRIEAEPCGPVERMTRSSRVDDCRLLSLLEEFHPLTPFSAARRTEARDPDSSMFKVLYFDLPGADPKTWNNEFKDFQTGRLPTRYHRFVKTYVHPFIERVEGTEEDAGYELVLQYWFFYPWNDGGNNHEGDWEHINVVVSPLGAVERALSADEVEALLRGEWIDATERSRLLVIKRVDYYFHHKVMTLDYSAPNAYLPRDAWQAMVDATFRERESEQWFWKEIRHRAYEDAAEQRINTHPIAFIGADNKGTDQILALPGAKNRDSHGTFPVAGLYKDVGPAGAAEEIGRSFDHKRFFSATPEGRKRWLERWRRGGVVWLASPASIHVVPDWERVIDLIHTEVRARAEWSWLVLPIRWGYPATPSPFAGIVAHAETGNLSVVGPAFNSGWNRSGVTDEYEDYSPHKVPRLFPLGWVDSFQNEWGFLNLTFPTMSALPPFDVLSRLVAAPIRAIIGRDKPTFYPRDRLPARFFGVSSGVSYQGPSDDLSDLWFGKRQFEEFIGRLLLYILENGSENTEMIGDEDVVVENTVAPFYEVSFFIGNRFSSQNMVRHSRSDVRGAFSFNDIPEDFTVEGDFTMWEYAGSMRYNLFTGNLQPYAKVGYGLCWYRIENARVNGEPLDEPDGDWVRKPSLIPLKNLLPNTWHIGAGIDALIIKGVAAPPRGLDVSLRAEWTRYNHNLGLETADLGIETLLLLGYTAETLPQDKRITRDEFRLGVTFSF